MSWRPPYYTENYYGHYGHPPQHRGFGRGFVNPSSNDYMLGRGYGRAHPEMPTMPQGFGRGRYPFNGPQIAENSAINKFTYQHQADSNTSSSSTTDFSSLSQSQFSQSQTKMRRSKKQQSNEEILSKEIEILQSVWNDNKYPDKKSKLEALFNKLSSLLANQSNPWNFAFNLITAVPDYDAAKTMTLSFQVLLQFERWVQSSHNVHAGDEEKFLSQDFRVQVFYAMTGRHIAYFSSAVDAFHLCHPGNEYFLPLAKALLLRDKLTEAAQVVSRLCLQSHFSREEILVPLLLTDRVNLIETYIKGDNQQQMLILNLLDYLCARNTDIVSFAQLSGLKNIKAEKLSKKSLSKFAMRLIKMFDIPPELCPNISENRAMSTVRFLLYKHYVEKSMTADCWDDMVESVIGNNVSLQQQFILELMSFNDVQEALKWVDKYQLPDSVLDPSVVAAKKNYIRENKDLTPQTHQSLTSSTSTFDNPSTRQPVAEMATADSEDKREEDEDWDKELSAPENKIMTKSAAASTVYYCLPLREDKVLLVDTRDKLTSALKRLTRPSTAIGMDCEWKPIGPSKQVALLQLAVEDCVFLVDFITMDGLITSQEWRHFAQSLFCDDRILKIGYGLDTDLRMLCSSYPSMKEPLMKMVRVIELSKLAKTVDDLLASREDLEIGNDGGDDTKEMKVGSSEEVKIGNYADNSDSNPNEKDSSVDLLGESSSSRVAFGFPVKNEEKGLSLLVKKIMGKPLCKDEQMSNWEKRPLRRSQILYAAMDAYVLLEIHNHLVSQAQSLGVTGREMLEPAVIFRSKTRLDKKKHKVNVSKKTPMPVSQSYTHATTSCRPHELRVVCDSMLQGLGNQLRSCGVDTHILSTGQLHDDAVQVALRENRIILTTGMPYEQVRSRVGEGMCYCVSNTLKSKDQCIDVLRHFKVDVGLDDIFSRCAVCNGADFAHIPSVDMEKLYVTNIQRSRQQPLHQPHHLQHHHHSATTAYPSPPGYSFVNVKDTCTDSDLHQRFLSKYGVDIVSLSFVHNGVRLQIETVTSLEVFQSIDVFFVCVTCGKVYWKGSHYERIQEQFQPILSLNTQTSGPGTSSTFEQNPADVVVVEDVVADVNAQGVDVDASCGDDNVGGVVADVDNDYYGEDHGDIHNDMENFNLQDYGFSGVWKIS